ncbi:MAG: hypothetical protein EU539_03840 [Promethearchaeota archaeon]|nr:MAG: hypothetical protein EU539_03840 [Candidatus Lokiarchaeota archaeon]
MSKIQAFDLDKIREIFIPIDSLHGKLNLLEEEYKKFIKFEEQGVQEIPSEDFSKQIQSVSKYIRNLFPHMTEISKRNLSKFLFIKDNLVKKYRLALKKDLKLLNLNQEKSKIIGLYLIDNKKISKIIDIISYIYSIELHQWLDIFDSLKLNSLYRSSVKKSEKFYSILIEKRLSQELNKIPEDTAKILVDDFKKAYREDPDITFQSFLRDIEKRLTKKDLDERKKFIKKNKEKKELEKLIKAQEAQKQAYQDYLSLSDREFERKRRKSKREKLSDLVEKTKQTEKIEITEEITEKIEKFKAKLGDSFQEKYMIQQDDEEDPINIIRKRKEEKEKEYKKYLNKFKEDE